MTSLDVYASESHYIDHIAPIWLRLPNDIKGIFRTVPKHVPHAARLGIKAETTSPTTNHTLVASWGDYKKTRGPIIYMEHGIGHTYSNGHPSYAGSLGRDRATLFLNQHVVTDSKNRSTYPKAEHAIIGIPKMDTVKQRGVQGSVVCISFHWDAKVAPESRSAFQHYERHIGDLTNLDGITILGHAHPRKGWQEKLEPIFKQNGIRFIPTFAKVLDQADFYVIDNSSTGYEFAAAGRPVIHMNAPWYRRNVNHGIRFWDHIPGPIVDTGPELLRTIPKFVHNYGDYEKQRLKVVKTLFPNLGHSTDVAVSVIKKHFGY